MLGMLAYLFVIFAFAVRFLPHPWAFTPVAASLLFFGAYRSRRQLWFPVALLAVSDVILTKFVYHYPFTWDHYVTWLWYAAVILLGTRLQNNQKPLWIGASALASSVSFFLLSNFAVWACFDMYPKNMGGLLTSYTMGIPFFRNDVIGTLMFTAAFFAVPALLRLPQTLRHRTTA
jgi:hypothetical protein